jgi:hypothetical protein
MALAQLGGLLLDQGGQFDGCGGGLRGPAPGQVDDVGDEAACAATPG